MVSEIPHITSIAQKAVLSDAQTIAQLEQWVEQYPACSAFRAMLAKAYKEAERSQANTKLELASLYASDREVLYHYMYYGLKITENKAVEEDLAVQAEVDPEESVEERVVTPIKEIKEEVESVDDSRKVAVETKPEETKERIENEVADDPEAKDDAEESKKTSARSGFVIDGNIEKAPEAKINFDDLIKYDPTIELKPIEKKDETPLIPLDLEYTPAYNPEVELAKLAEQKEEDADKDFLYWLNHVGDEVTEKTEVVEEDEQEVSSSVDEVTDLLEKFLQNSKRRAPKEKREFYKAEEKARKSEIDDSDMVSETLAKLYIKQELYQKAIETYRKLSLQIPEKSAYFAARITEVEELKNSKED